MTEDDPFIDPDILRAANARHDAEKHSVSFDPHARVRSSWNERRLIVRKPLTDKQIERYSTLGFYSEDFRAARRNHWQRKKKGMKTGNFRMVEDRLIYSP